MAPARGGGGLCGRRQTPSAIRIAGGRIRMTEKTETEEAETGGEGVTRVCRRMPPLL